MTRYGFITDSKVLPVNLLLKPLREKLEKICDTKESTGKKKVKKKKVRHPEIAPTNPTLALTLQSNNIKKRRGVPEALNRDSPAPNHNKDKPAPKMPTARSSTARSKTAPVPQMLRPRPRPLSPKPLPRSRVAPVSIAPIPKMPTPCPFIAPAPKISLPKQMFSPTRLSPPVTSSRVYILPDELRKEKSPPRSSVHTSPTKRVTFVEPTVIFERW